MVNGTDLEEIRLELQLMHWLEINLDFVQIDMQQVEH